MNDALTTLDSWVRCLRMSLTDAALAVHGSAVPRAVPAEALAKLRCSLFAANNALDELLDQIKGAGADECATGFGEGSQIEHGRQAAFTR